MQAYVRAFLVAVIAITYVLCVSRIVSASCNRLALVTLDAATYDSARTIIAGLEDRGFRVRHIFPPNHLIGEASESLIGELRHAAGVSGVETPPLADASKRAGSSAPDIFEQILISLSSPASADENPTTEDEPLTGCQVSPRIAEPADSADTNLVMQAMPPADYLFTSEYLMGRVAVAILLVESTGDAENWTTSAEDSAIAGLSEAPIC